jgi:cephalosporin-C deacetylase-like acetyl esterase
LEIQDLENYSLSIYDVKDQLKQYVYNRSNDAFSSGDKARDDIESKKQLENRQAYIRKKFIEAIGGLPASDTPLNAKITGTVECDGFKIEKVIFESRPNTFVTSNLYIPDGVTSPRGAVLFLSGHHDQAKHHPEYQTVCQYLVKAGLIVLSMDPPGQGERLNYYEASLKDSTIRPGTGEHDYMGSQCWPVGDSLARYFVHDAMRAVDYLCTRREVNPAKIGVTGNSGGGTQTSMVVICDPRIAAVAPATFIMNRKDYLLAGQAQDAEQIWPGFTALGFDHEDILLMMVPKPVRVLAVRYDFFPIDATRRTVQRTKRFWELYNKIDNIDLIEDDSVHRYTPALAKAAAEFFSKHLLGKVSSLQDNEIKSLEPSELWCTKSGQIRGEIEHARTIYEENCDQLHRIEENRQALGEHNQEERALKWLRDKVYTNRIQSQLNPRLYMVNDHVDELMVYNGIWWSQEGLFNHGILFRDFHFKEKELPLTIAVWDNGTNDLQTHFKWIRDTCSSGRAVLVLDVSGVGKLSPNSLAGNIPPREFYGVIHKLTDDLIWLNDSMVALRTYDVIRALELVDFLPEIQNSDIQIYAQRRQGIYTQLAAFLDQRIEHIEVENGMESIGEWVKSRYYDHFDIMSLVLPGMLKYFDLPDLKKWGTDKYKIR